MAALEQQTSGQVEVADTEVADLTASFENRVEDVTDPEWNMTEPDTTAPVLEAPNNSEYYSAQDEPNADEAAGGEVIDFPSPMPSSLDTQEQVDDYTQNTLISPETASANGTGDLDMRLAS